METAEQIKEVVRQKYGEIAQQHNVNECCEPASLGLTSCCDSKTASNVPIDMAVGYDPIFPKQIGMYSAT